MTCTTSVRQGLVQGRSTPWRFRPCTQPGKPSGGFCCHTVRSSRSTPFLSPRVLLYLMLCSSPSHHHKPATSSPQAHTPKPFGCPFPTLCVANTTEGNPRWAGGTFSAGLVCAGCRALTAQAGGGGASQRLGRGCAGASCFPPGRVFPRSLA